MVDIAFYEEDNFAENDIIKSKTDEEEIESDEEKIIAKGSRSNSIEIETN